MSTTNHWWPCFSCSYVHRLLSLVVGRFLATPSVRSERRVSPSVVFVIRGGLPSSGKSAVGESLKTRPMDHDVGKLCLQQLPRRVFRQPCPWPVLTGFRNYGLPDLRPIGPTLPWNQTHGEVLADMDECFRSSLKFHHVTTAERSGFTSTGALLTPWSSQVLAPLSRYHMVTLAVQVRPESN